MIKLVLSFFMILTLSLADSLVDDTKMIEGKKVFETYCWGCHHQTAVAFGPSFAQIASMRSEDEIRAMITDPKSVSKILGYKRNAMPAFKLTDKELTLISNYILSFKEVETHAVKEKNGTNEKNTTKVEDAYPNIAIKKEMK